MTNMEILKKFHRTQQKANLFASWETYAFRQKQLFDAGTLSKQGTFDCPREIVLHYFNENQFIFFMSKSK